MPSLGKRHAQDISDSRILWFEGIRVLRWKQKGPGDPRAIRAVGVAISDTALIGFFAALLQPLLIITHRLLPDTRAPPSHCHLIPSPSFSSSVFHRPPFFLLCMPTRGREAPFKYERVLVDAELGVRFISDGASNQTKASPNRFRRTLNRRGFFGSLKATTTQQILRPSLARSPLQSSPIKSSSKSV